MKFQLISKYVNNATIHWKRSYFILNQQDPQNKKDLHIIFFSSSIIWSRFSTHKIQQVLFLFGVLLYTPYTHQTFNFYSPKKRSKYYTIRDIDRASFYEFEFHTHNSVHGSKLKKNKKKYLTFFFFVSFGFIGSAVVKKN